MKHQLHIGRAGRFHATAAATAEHAMVTKVVDDTHVDLVVVAADGTHRDQTNVIVESGTPEATASNYFTFGHPADDAA